MRDLSEQARRGQRSRRLSRALPAAKPVRSGELSRQAPGPSVVALAATIAFLTACPCLQAADAKQERLTPKASSSAGATIAKSGLSQNAVSGSSHASAAARAVPPKTSKKRWLRAGFIPPPPPVVPTLSADMAVPGELIDLMSEQELSELKQKLETELAHTKRRYDELAHDTGELAKKAASFDQLYAEGVISRRELETCKREAERLQADFAEIKVQRDDLEKRLERAGKKLAGKYKQKPNPVKVK